MNKYVILTESVEKHSLLKIISHPRYWKKFSSFAPKHTTMWNLVKYDNLFPLKAYDYLINKVFHRTGLKGYSKTLLKMYKNKWTIAEFVHQKIEKYFQKQIENNHLKEIN